MGEVTVQNETIGQINNETIGQSAEYAICNISQIPCQISLERIDPNIVQNLQTSLIPFFALHPEIVIINSVGYMNGSIDFELANGETLSLKTIKNRDGKICPQTVGQPTIRSWDSYWVQHGYSPSYDIQEVDINLLLNYNSERFQFIKENIHQFQIGRAHV